MKTYTQQCIVRHNENRKLRFSTESDKDSVKSLMGGGSVIIGENDHIAVRVNTSMIDIVVSPSIVITGVKRCYRRDKDEIDDYTYSNLIITGIALQSFWDAHIPYKMYSKMENSFTYASFIKKIGLDTFNELRARVRTRTVAELAKSHGYTKRSAIRSIVNEIESHIII